MLFAPPAQFRPSRSASAVRALGAVLILSLTAGLLQGGAAEAAAATQGIPPEIPLVPRLGTGARALGMGGAYVAVADDYTAMYYNPAGLALLPRVEFAGVLDKRSTDQLITYLGNRETTPLEKSGIQSLGFAYPFPTYRGSMVIGLSYDRVAPLDFSFYRAGRGGPVAGEEEGILEDGGVGAYRAGFAADVGPNLSLGVTGVILAGSSTRERTFDYVGTNGIDQEHSYSSTTIDYSAVTGSLGAMLRLSTEVRMGLTLHLPESFTLDGTVTDSTLLEYQVGDSTYAYSLPYGSGDFKDKIRLPFRVAVGLSYAPSRFLRGLLLSADATYADWTGIDYNGPLRTPDRGYAYRATTDLRLGAEYALAQAPVRLRAGFVSQPLAYRLVATDLFEGRAGAAHFDTDLRYFTGGVGVLLNETLTLDVAYLSGKYQRWAASSRTGQTLEEVKDRRLLFGAAFRL